MTGSSSKLGFYLPRDGLVEIGGRTYRHLGDGLFVGHRHDELPFAVDVSKKESERQGPRALSIRQIPADPDEWPRVLTLYFAQLPPGTDDTR